MRTKFLAVFNSKLNSRRTCLIDANYAASAFLNEHVHKSHGLDEKYISK